MNGLLLSMILLMALVGGLRGQVEPPRPALPTPELVKSLIMLEEEIRTDSINVAMILRGEVCCEGSYGNFVGKDAARVLMVMPEFKDGRRLRRVSEKIFLWSEKWGWFAYRQEMRRGGEVILIFSEKEGLAEIR